MLVSSPGFAAQEDEKGAAPPSRLHKVFINKADKSLAEVRKLIKPVKSIDYPNKVLFILDNDNLELLRKTLGNVTTTDRQNILYIRNRRIDTTLEIPDIQNRELRQQETTGKRLTIIQFSGPVKREWYDTLTGSRGIDVVSSIRHNAYIVSSDQNSIKSLAENSNISPYIQWIGPFHPAYKLDEKFSRKDIFKKLYNNQDLPIEVVIQVVKTDTTENSINIINSITRKTKSTSTLGRLVNIQTFVEKQDLARILRIPDVLFVELYIPASSGAERLGIIISNQDSMGSLPATRSSDYLAWLTQHLEQTPGMGDVADFNFILDITDHPNDSGLTTLGNVHKVFNNATSTATRVLYQQSHNSLAPPQDKAGHGTFVGSVAAGYPIDGAAANNHIGNYRHGLGIAPFAKIGSTQNLAMLDNRDACDGAGACNSLCAGNGACTTSCLMTPYECALDTNASHRNLMRAAYNNTAGGTVGARISNHSWGSGISDNSYGTTSQLFDAMTRDVDNLAAGEQPMLFVFLAGNLSASEPSGTNGLWGHGSTAKNTITVGGSATDNQRTPDSADGCGYSNADATGMELMYPKSAFGPTTSGMLKPDLVAPAMRIQAAITGDAEYPAKANGICESGTFANGEFPSGHVLYSQSTGTSFAAPAVAGAAANLRHWLTSIKSLNAPKPALLKAWLINSARYMTATGGNLPSAGQGMGRLDLERALDETPRLIRNETNDLAQAASFTLTGKVSDPAQPLRVVLAWTDAVPSIIDGGLVNNLDLELNINGTAFYCGNDYSNDSSNSHASAATCTLDTSNNVESISVPATALAAGDSFTITVTADNIPLMTLITGGSNTNQDFALVAYNADLLITNTGMTVNQGASNVVITTAMLSAGIPSDRSATNIVYTLASDIPAAIGILRNGVTALGMGSSFTQQDLISGSINFTPVTTTGMDTSFSFTVSDGIGTINAPTRVFTIGINAAPTAVADAYTVDEGATLTVDSVPPPNPLTANDSDPDGDSLQNVSLSGPAPLHGMLTLNTDGTFTYTHDGSETVMDSFSYTVGDGALTSTPATVTIGINPVNDPPVAVDDTAPATLIEDDAMNTVMGNVKTNDSDAEGDATISLVSGAIGTYGAIAMNPDGSYTYTLNNTDPDTNALAEGATASDVFTYQIADAAFNDTGTLTINITGNNDAPIATDDTAASTLIEDNATTTDMGNVKTNDSDAEGDATISLVSGATGTYGSILLNPDGSYTYTLDNADPDTNALAGGAAASDVFTYQIADAEFNDTGTLTINITGNNDAPQLDLNGADGFSAADATTTSYAVGVNQGDTGPQAIVDASLTLTDPDSMIGMAVIDITNSPIPDGSDESLAVDTVLATSLGINVSAYDAANGTLTLSNNAPADSYAQVLRTLAWQDQAQPDGTHPVFRTGQRIIQVSITDAASATNLPAPVQAAVNVDRGPVDIVLVLDKSGSMGQMPGGAGQTKLAMLQDAVEVFINAWSGYSLVDDPADPGDPTDRIGVVSFSSTTEPPAGNLAPLLDYNDTTAMQVIADVNAITHAGATAMGGGLQQGINSLLTSTRDKFIILFTDGMQNCEPHVNLVLANGAPGNPDPYNKHDISNTGFGCASGVVPAPATLLGSYGITMHTIGTGVVTGTQWQNLLNDIALQTSGAEHHFTTDPVNEMQSFFMQTLVASLSQASLEMVAHEQDHIGLTDKPREYRFALNNAAKKASFILSWRPIRRDNLLRFGLRAPNGTVIPLDNEAIRIKRGKFYTMLHISFPIKTAHGDIPAGGEWQMVISPLPTPAPAAPLAVPVEGTAATLAATSPGARLDYDIWVLEDDLLVKDNTRSDQPDYAVNRPILVTTQLVDGLHPARGMRVTSRVTAPRIGAGTILAKNPPRGESQGPDSAGTDKLADMPTPIELKLSRLLQDPQIRELLVPRNEQLMLHDDGMHGDASANDGIYSALYNATGFPGNYRFTIDIDGKLPVNGRLMRTRTIDVPVRMKTFSVDRSRIAITQIKGEQANLRLTITPIDAQDNYLGPGFADSLAIDTGESVHLAGKVIDNLDGSYSIDLSYTGLLGGTVRVTIGDTVFTIGTGILPLVYWLIALLLLVLALATYLVWRRRN